MAATSLDLTLRGIDKTTGMLNSVGSKIASIGRAFVSAFAVRGVYNAITGTAKELGNLSDEAGRLNVAVPALQKMEHLFGQLGIGGKQLVEQTFQGMAQGLAKASAPETMEGPKSDESVS